MSRQKGNRFERSAARQIIAADGPDPIIGGLASTTGRVGHLDLGADFYSRRFAGECKHRQSIAGYLWDWLLHINPRGHRRLLVIKRDREEPLVVLALTDFLDLIDTQEPNV